MLDEKTCTECGQTIWASKLLDLDDTDTLCWRCERVRQLQNEKKKCECGAEKCGFQYHAWWCDLYFDPMAPDPNKKDKPPLKRR